MRTFGFAVSKLGLQAGTRLKNIALVTKTRALPKTAWLQVQCLQLEPGSFARFHERRCCGAASCDLCFAAPHCALGLAHLRLCPKLGLQVVRHFEPAHYEALIKRQIAELERQLIGIHNGRAPRRLAAV